MGYEKRSGEYEEGRCVCVCEKGVNEEEEGRECTKKGRLGVCVCVCVCVLLGGGELKCV